MQRNKNVNTHQIFILDQAIMLPLIINLTTMKVSLPEIISQLKMLKIEQLDVVKDYQLDADDQEDTLYDNKQFT